MAKKTTRRKTPAGKPAAARAQVARKRKAAKKARPARAAGRRTAPARKAAGKAAGRKAARPAKRAGAKARKAAPARKPAAAKKAAPARKPSGRTASPKAARAAAPKTAAARKVAPAAATPKPAAPKRATPATSLSKPRTAPGLARERRTVATGAPSSLGTTRHASAAASGAEELRVRLASHTGTGPEITAGDVDANWEAAESVGDEAPGGDNPTPDQDVVDEIGRALGIEYDDDEELQGGEEIAARDHDRWELDPASSDDFDER